MKPYIVLFAILCCICSCTKSRVSEQESLEDAILSAQTANQTENKLFLGLRFGMSEQQVIAHLDSLHKAGKIEVGDDGGYVYEFATEAFPLMVSFVGHYHNDSLYVMDYILRPKDGFGTPKTSTIFAAGVFSQTNTSGFKYFSTEDALGEAEYHFIKNNLIVRFYQGASVGFMSYINAPVEKRVDLIKESKKDQELQQTISDF